MLGFLARLKDTWGDVVRFRIAVYPFVLLSDPEAVRDVLVTHADRFTKGRALKMSRAVLGEGLVTSEGELHRRQRRLIQPAFARPRLEHYGRIMTACAARWAEEWADGRTVDMAHEMRRLALAIVGRALFGDEDVDLESQEVIEALATTTRMFRRVMNPLTPLLGRLPLPSNRRFNAARDRLDATVARLIGHHRAAADGAAGQENGPGHGDLLSLLLAARDEDGGGRMSDLQVRDEVLTLFAAGHETTALALAWTWYLLARHTEVESRLHEELDRVLAGRPATLGDAECLPYTRRVLTESMRLYPPAYATGRMAEADHPVGRWVVERGTTVIMSQYLIQRDARFYADPHRFDPDRWTDGFRGALPRFAYFPFGGGPRVCIGESFAWAEATIVLATLAQRWGARLVPGPPVVPEPMITLRPRGGIPMTLHERG